MSTTYPNHWMPGCSSPVIGQKGVQKGGDWSLVARHLTRRNDHDCKPCTRNCAYNVRNAKRAWSVGGAYPDRGHRHLMCDEPRSGWCPMREEGARTLVRRVVHMSRWTHSDASHPSSQPGRATLRHETTCRKQATAPSEPASSEGLGANTFFYAQLRVTA